jgi:hypothetical protein
MRHRIIMPVDVDMVIEPHPSHPPLSVFKGFVRQWFQRRAVELEKQIAAADTQAAHRLVLRWATSSAIAWFTPGLDPGGEEPSVPQPRQDPAFDHQHADLDFRLVARLARARRQNRRAVMRRQPEIGPVEPRLLPAGAVDADLLVIGHELRRHTAHEREGANVRANPVGSDCVQLASA